MSAALDFCGQADYAGAAMATPSLGDVQFLLGDCHGCEKRVLGYLAIDPPRELARRCIHCNERLAEPLIPISSAELEAHGYSLMEARLCGNGGGGSPTGCGQGTPMADTETVQ